jgi:twinkle protein
MNLDACIIDPLIKFSRPKEISDRDDIYAGYVTQMCTDFCRQANISLHLVMHQLTPKVTEAGFYPKPSMYTVKGGGSWSDSVDNVLSTWRPMYAKDKIDSQVILSSLKIKDQKGVGIPQDIKVRFDRRSNRYIDFENGKSLFDFDSIMYPKISLKI